MCSQPVTAKQSEAFIERAWDKRRWERGSPRSSTLKAWRKKLKCAGPANRKAMKRRWRAAKRSYYGHRHAERERHRVTPYDCKGGPSAIPCYITACESGDSYTAENPSGAYGRYQLMPEWWDHLGRKPTPAEQDLIAADLWDGGAGAGNWVCA